LRDVYATRRSSFLKVQGDAADELQATVRLVTDRLHTGRLMEVEVELGAHCVWSVRKVWVRFAFRNNKSGLFACIPEFRKLFEVVFAIIADDTSIRE
jgi:hypothetical protein